MIRTGLMVTLVMIAAVAIMIILPVVSEGEIPGQQNEEWYFRLLGVAGILDVLGTVVVPVLAIFVKDAPAIAVVDGADAAAGAPAAAGRLTLDVPADVAQLLEKRAATDGVDAAEAAVAALRRGLQ